MKLKGINFKVLRVDGDHNGNLMPTRILLAKEGIVGEYILEKAVNSEGKCVQRKQGE